MDKEIDFPYYVDPDDMDINCKEWELVGLTVTQNDAPVADNAVFPTARIQVLTVIDPTMLAKTGNWQHDGVVLAKYERRVDHFNGEYEDWRKL